MTLDAETRAAVVVQVSRLPLTWTFAPAVTEAAHWAGVGALGPDSAARRLVMWIHEKPPAYVPEVRAALDETHAPKEKATRITLGPSAG